MSIGDCCTWKAEYVGYWENKAEELGRRELVPMKSAIEWPYFFMSVHVLMRVEMPESHASLEKMRARYPRPKEEKVNQK